MEWISVEDRLPESKKFGTPVLAKLPPKDLPRVNGDIVISIFYNDVFHWEFWKGKKQDVTHWQPLPEAPKY